MMLERTLRRLIEGVGSGRARSIVMNVDIFEGRAVMGRRRFIMPGGLRLLWSRHHYDTGIGGIVPRVRLIGC
jgi:hypothetical protein